MIAKAQPNFQPNALFSLCFPFFCSGVLLQNHTTLLVLKRFLCGYEACHLSTTKVQSPQFSDQFFPSELQRCTTAFALLTTTTNNQPKSPCCPHLNMQDTTHQIFLAATNESCKKLMHETNQFHQFLCTLPFVQHFPAVTNKEASSLSFKPRSQQTNSTLKHSRSVLNLSFSVAHSLTSFSLLSLSSASPLNLLSAAILLFIPPIICHFRFNFTPPSSTHFLRQPSTIIDFVRIIFVLFPYNTPTNLFKT